MEKLPGSCHWKPLFLAARGSAAPPQLVLITLTGSRTCCGGLSPPQSQPCRQKQTSPRFPLPARLGCAQGQVRRQEQHPHPTHSPACRGLSSSARLLMGTPRPSPPPWHCQSSFPTPRKPTLPVPSTMEPRPAGFYVCRAFGKTECLSPDLLEGRFPAGRPQTHAAYFGPPLSFSLPRQSVVTVFTWAPCLLHASTHHCVHHCGGVDVGRFPGSFPSLGPARLSSPLPPLTHPPGCTRGCLVSA